MSSSATSRARSPAPWTTGPDASRPHTPASIFLDEINSTSPKLQVKLLRVLQEGEFERVGDNNTKKVDTRIVAATNRDLLDEIDGGPVSRRPLLSAERGADLPAPLREHREDVEPLVLFFLKRYGEQNKRDMLQGPARRPCGRLSEHDWPGNVRELQNYVERAVILGTGTELLVEHLPPQFRGEPAPRPIRHRGSGGGDFVSLAVELVRQGIRAAGPAANDLHDRVVGQVERELIQQVLQICDRVQIKAAARLGINRNTLHKKLAEYRIDESVAGPGAPCATATPAPAICMTTPSPAPDLATRTRPTTKNDGTRPVFPGTIRTASWNSIGYTRETACNRFRGLGRVRSTWFSPTVPSTSAMITSSTPTASQPRPLSLVRGVGLSGRCEPEYFRTGRLGSTAPGSSAAVTPTCSTS